MACVFPLETLSEGPESFGPGHHATSWLVNLPKEFSRLSDLEMHWVTLRDDVKKPMAFQAQGANFHVLPTTLTGRASSLYRKDLHALHGYLRALRPDVVHGWGTEDVYALAAVTSGYPHLISMQGILSHYCLRNRMKPRDYFQALLELWCLQKAQRVTVESEWGCRILKRRRWGGPIDLVEYGVRNSFFEVPWTPDPENPVALFIGTLHPRKGIEDLLGAFHGLPGKLQVIGKGDRRYVEKIKTQAPSNVEWVGELGVEQVQARMAKAWCLALPTRADTSPNVVKEARVVGLPVLTTACGGQSSYLKDQQDGYLLEPGNIESTRRALGLLFDNYAKTKRLGSAGRIKYRDIFAASRTAEKFRALYFDLAQKRAG